ncbi:Mex67p NDAI_0K01220 [Naumovozyma dairenensis CBS 421]|uniref:mRNA export factor MEX67 n=1 Tax=Naumovozyma dairenensis (strain ATCC 10597 / BCRC 20456 / CBS 421 / NBRC 0211 / NRRL Y-12639) TaxID=1071378 RepID=G0WHQ2_NAUDC|nr:hypothetical protein NDAI_0K01220 [Naumovozyma dairenensis CBS 421]CCD27313.1 hypothetical protein NDAI_0K01220 [Naumovozyma dairenensis CBS 421]
MNGGFHNVNNINAMAQQQAQQNRVRVAVYNWQNATVQDLLSYISRTMRVAIQDSFVEDNRVVGFVNTKTDADNLMKWNGMRFSGQNLKFEILDDISSSTSTTITFFRNTLFKRYDPQSKMLNLGNLYNDPDLVSQGLFSKPSTQSKLLPGLLKVASKEPQLIVDSLNLSDNSIKDVKSLSTLAQTFPNLKNLCLANNQIFKIQSLDIWKNKFKELRELLMTNNPITNSQMYKTEMLRLFPKLIVLDNVIVRDEQKLNSIFTLPMKIQQFFFENNELGSSSTDFVTNFLNLWDNDRNQLLNLYTPQSQFSIAVDTSQPPSTVEELDANPSFGYYLSMSRNICKVSSEKSIQQRLYLGPEFIGNVFKALPKSKHYLQERSNDYSMEAIAYPQVNGFLITLHGVFDEVAKPDFDINGKQAAKSSTSNRNRRYNHGHSPATNRLSKKSFDRTWVIVPMNNTVVIASDLLTVRPFVSNAWSTKQQPQSQSQQSPVAGIPTGPSSAAGAISGTPTGATSTPPIIPNQQQQQQQIPPALAPTLQLPPNVQAGLTPIQLDLLSKLHLQTKLNAEYTYMLAEQSGWNYDVALKAFQTSINNLPSNAFIQ